MRLVVALALALGCKGDKQADRPPANSALFAGEASLEGSVCADPPTAGEPQELHVAVVIGAGVSIDDAQNGLTPARALLARHGLQFRAAPGLVEQIADRYLLGGTIDGLKKRIEAAKLPATARLEGSPQVRELVAAEIAGPLSGLMKRRARDDGVLDLVFVDRIASPLSPVQMVVPELVGLTLSPILGTDDHPAIQLALALETPNEVPTVLISLRELKQVPPIARRAVVAHEIGHALGLAHFGQRDSLMSRDRNNRCLPVLEPGQHRDLLRAARRLAVRFHERKKQ